MNLSSFAIALAAGAVTLALSQIAIVTAKAQPTGAAPCRVRIQWQKADRVPGGLMVRGWVTNIGSRPLVYTQVAPALIDRAGRVVYMADGYLTVSPLLPGASAEFRAYGPRAPLFARVRTAFREAGQPVYVEPSAR